MSQTIPSYPLDPQVEQIVRESFSRQGLMQHLGAELNEVSRGRVSIVLPFHETLTQQHGYFHAGGTSAIADSAGGYAGFAVFTRDSCVLRVVLKHPLLPPAQRVHCSGLCTVARCTHTHNLPPLGLLRHTAQAR